MNIFRATFHVYNGVWLGRFFDERIAAFHLACLICTILGHFLQRLKGWRKFLIFITSQAKLNNSLRILDVPYDSYLHKKKLMLVAAQWRDCYEIFPLIGFPSSFHLANRHVMCTIFEIDGMCTTSVSSLGSHNTLERWLHHSLQTLELRHLNHPHRAGVLVHLNMFVILMVSGHFQARRRSVLVHFEWWIDGSLAIRDGD